MRLSIVIPVYNVEAYVGRTLESVFDTTASADDFEVIVVNDGTRDGSMEEVRHFAGRPNITVLEQENRGLSAARMSGLALAKGEYVWFVDSDDFLVEDGVGMVLSLLKERPDVLMFPLRWMYEDGTPERLDFEIEGNRIISGKEVIRDLCLPVWAVQRFVLKRSLLENEWLHFPEGLMHEDEYFGPVLLCTAKRVHVLDSSVYCYRVREGSLMLSLSVKSAYSLVSIHKRLMQFMEVTMTPEDRQWFRPYCCRLLQLSYQRLSHLFGASGFNRFVRENRSYVWRQWLAVHRERPLMNKLGRWFYFMMPGTRQRFLGMLAGNA